MCELITTIKDRIQECMRKANSFERDILKTVLGEVETIKSRTGKMDDNGVIKVFKKFKQGVEDTIQLLEKEGAEGDLSHLRVEVEIYDKYIPASMSLFEIMEYLKGKDLITNAASDGQATGMAMGMFKRAGLSVDGKTVGQAVAAMRS